MPLLLAQADWSFWAFKLDSHCFWSLPSALTPASPFNRPYLLLFITVSDCIGVDKMYNYPRMRNECTWGQIKVPSAWTHTIQQRKDSHSSSLPLYVPVIWRELSVIQICPLCKSEGSWFRWCEYDQHKNQEYYFYGYSLSSVQFSSVQSHSHVWLFVTPWTAKHQASLSTTNSQSLLKLMSIELVMPSKHLILCCPLLLRLQSFPASSCFQMKNPCIPVINPPWLWCMNFLMFCWILFAKILLRIFASMFISDTEVFFFCVVFVWCWYQGDRDLIEWVLKRSLLCNSLKEY